MYVEFFLDDYVFYSVVILILHDDAHGRLVWENKIFNKSLILSITSLKRSEHLDMK